MSVTFFSRGFGMLALRLMYLRKPSSHCSCDGLTSRAAQTRLMVVSYGKTRLLLCRKNLYACGEIVYNMLQKTKSFAEYRAPPLFFVSSLHCSFRKISASALSSSCNSSSQMSSSNEKASPSIIPTLSSC
ncbi:unnamed protein product [Ixodes pacificus]